MEHLLKIDCHIHASGGETDPARPQHMSVEDIKRFYRVLEIEYGVIQASHGQNPESIAALCGEYPDLFRWFCPADPASAPVTREFLSSMKKLGAAGVGEFVTNLPFDDTRVMDMLGHCEALSLPFLFHMSPRVGNSYGVVDKPGLPLFENALQSFPNLVFIGHSMPFWAEIDGAARASDEARSGYPFGPVKEGRLHQLFRRYPNLYADLSANSGANALMRDPAHAVRFLDEFQDRLMFGTDSLVCPLGPWLNMLCQQKVLSFDAYRKICRENVIRVLNI